MRARMLVLSVLLAASPLAAQEPAPGTASELRTFVGAFVPTGDQRDDFGSATTLGVQAAVELYGRLHLLGTIGWTHAHNRLGLEPDATNIWQVDLGVEGSLVYPLGSSWSLQPFLGAGAGLRTHEYRAAAIGSRVCTAGYAALGTELVRHAIALRLEGRNYVTCFESPITGVRSTRHDLGLMVGIAYHIR